MSPAVAPADHPTVLHVLPTTETEASQIVQHYLDHTELEFDEIRYHPSSSDMEGNRFTTSCRVLIVLPFCDSLWEAREIQRHARRICVIFGLNPYTVVSVA